MKKTVIRIIGVFFSITAAFPLSAANRVSSDTLCLGVGFAQGKYNLDYGDNAERLTEFVSVVDSAYGGVPYQIVIHSTASPEGNVRSNFQLSRNRGNALGGYLRSHLHHRPDSIIVIPHGEDWDGLADMVAGLDTSWRDKVLSIVRSDLDTLAKKRRLRAIDGGSVWRWLLENKYPQLRKATNALILPVYERTCLPSLSMAQPGLPVPLDTPAVELCIEQKEERHLAIAVKSNLLSDAVLAPNIEVEISFNDRWSLAFDWTFPWWLFRHNSYCEELLGGTVQGRRYFGDRASKGYFTGWYAGVYAGLGYYDFQMPSKGAQGEYAHAGIAGGYSKKLGEYFNLEFELGIGGLLTQYRKYIPKEDYTVLLYQETVWTTWVGPTRAKVSLIWRLGKKCRSNYKR